MFPFPIYLSQGAFEVVKAIGVAAATVFATAVGAKVGAVVAEKIVELKEGKSDDVS